MPLQGGHKVNQYSDINALIEEGDQIMLLEKDAKNRKQFKHLLNNQSYDCGTVSIMDPIDAESMMNELSRM